MLKNLFKKKKYLNCPFMKHSLHFFYDEIRACCTNVKGPVFYPDYKGEKVDWDCVFQVRTNIFKEIKSFFNKNELPSVCEGCCDAFQFYANYKPNDFENKIDRIYFHNHMSCNAKCTYCTYGYIERGYRYEVLPLVKELIEKNILSENALIYMSGGEITISKEFEELLSLLLSYLNSQIEILTSGIKYCKSIEEAFKQNKCRLVISPDSGSRETYLKIKQVDCFDKVVENLRTYVQASDNAKNTITLKYILVDNVNDNIEEIEKFLILAQELGIVNVRLDIDYEKYKFTSDSKVPEHYFELYEFFNKTANEKCLTVCTCNQVEAILKKSN